MMTLNGGVHNDKHTTDLLVPVFARAIRGMADLHWTAAVAELGAMLEVSSLQFGWCASLVVCLSLMVMVTL